MKRLLSLVLLCVLLVILSGCGTTVHVRHLVPGEVDLSGSRNLAIASTSSYRFSYGRPVSPWVSGLQETDFTLSSGFDADIPDRVAAMASQYLISAIEDKQYFTLLSPDATDAYLSLSKAGEDSVRLLTEKGFSILMTSEISYMDVTERVEGVDRREFVTNSSGLSSEQVTKREYYLVQEATLGLSYMISNLKTGRVLVSDSSTDKEEKRTRIGIRYYQDDGTYRDERDYTSGFSPSFDSLFQNILERITERVAIQLAPSWQTEHFSLMKNKPKVPSLEMAYDLAKQGEYHRAYEQFLKTWMEDQHLGSGYNASLMLAGLGKLQEAVDLMNQVYNLHGDTRSHDTLLILQEALSQDAQAQKQISGEISDDGQGVVMTQYMIME
ncbi:MAG: hypothetical protein AB7D92_02640 [Sphaerochaeta sp.]